MTFLEIKVDGSDKNLYVNDFLNRQLQKIVKVGIHKKDKDGVYIVDGEEGSGKSVLAMQLGRVLDENFCIERVCFTPEEFTKAIIRSKKGQCVIYDEAFTGLSSRGSLSEVNKLLVSLMMEMRQKNLFVIIVMPTFFLLDKYVAIWRARGLFHVYTQKGRRGSWMFFNRNKKKILYLLGKKLYDYSQPRSSFKGRFYDQYVINEQEYREKKKKAMSNKSRVTKAATFLNQRNSLLWLLFDKYKNSHTQIARLCTEVGFKLDRTSISKLLLDKKKQLLEQEVMEEEVLQQEKESIELDEKINEKGGTGLKKP